jgi:hypothetical protein
MGPSVRLSGTFTDPIARPASDGIPPGMRIREQLPSRPHRRELLEGLYIHKERLMWILRTTCHGPPQRTYSYGTLTPSQVKLGHRLGSERGSPNHGSTEFSKRVRAQIRLPARARTKRPTPWLIPSGPRTYVPNAG